MALSLDGSGEANSGGTTSISASLTTTTGSGVIVVTALNLGGVTPNTPTGSGLTFTLRKSISPASNETQSIWTAPYSSNFSGNITVTQGSAQFITIVVWGIGGADTSTIFDSNASLPAFTTGGAPVNDSVTFSTSNANDFIFWVGCPTNNGVGDSYTMSDSSTVSVISSQDYCTAVYTIASATKSSVHFTDASEVQRVSIADAIIQASGGGGDTLFVGGGIHFI